MRRLGLRDRREAKLELSRIGQPSRERVTRFVVRVARQKRSLEPSWAHPRRFKCRRKGPAETSRESNTEDDMFL